jgi:hypothetical protein
VNSSRLKALNLEDNFRFSCLTVLKKWLGKWEGYISSPVVQKSVSVDSFLIKVTVHDCYFGSSLSLKSGMPTYRTDGKLRITSNVVCVYRSTDRLSVFYKLFLCSSQLVGVFRKRT